MASHARPLHVEIDLQTSDVTALRDELWRRTQTPDLHQRWDLRFTEIRYLPRANESDPQRFLYSTRIGFGRRVEGWGESVATRAGENGESTSVLRFGSDSRLSLIRSGSGYWSYRPIERGVRFGTGYDYEVRFGWLGRAVDRLVFRPLIGWATAWSFDRLRLWLERGLDPAYARRVSVVNALARFALAFTFVWHGLVPKLITQDPLEEHFFVVAGLAPAGARDAARVLGVLEILLGLLHLAWWRSRWPLRADVFLMVAALLAVAWSDPGVLARAFNPLTLNLLVAVLAVIALVVHDDLPSARRCRRRPSRAP